VDEGHDPGGNQVGALGGAVKSLHRPPLLLKIGHGVGAKRGFPSPGELAELAREGGLVSCTDRPAVVSGSIVLVTALDLPTSLGPADGDQCGRSRGDQRQQPVSVSDNRALFGVDVTDPPAGGDDRYSRCTRLGERVFSGLSSASATRRKDRGWRWPTRGGPRPGAGSSLPLATES